jgi:hypothetical protein
MPRTLYKPGVIGFYFRDSSGTFSVDNVWDVIYHSEANHPFHWTAGDIRIFTTANILKTPPLFSVRFGVKLPNAPNEYEQEQLPDNAGMSGAGTDNTDFMLSFLSSYPYGPFAFDANLGIIIMDSPTNRSEQLDDYYLGVGIRYRHGAFKGSIESNRSLGPRRFDNYHDIVLKAEYDFDTLFLGLKQGFGLNGSTDDIQSGIYIGFKK